MIDFSEFLAESSGLRPDGQPSPSGPRRDPYDWQERFAQACLAGKPPRVVGVPTGAGKTTAVDALVWALAAQIAGRRRRTLGTRIVWAIDRRLLVDEVHEHASRLSLRLDIALADSGDPLHEVAAALADLSGGKPLIATRWRGGLDERAEFHSPLQPEVITSTVAQIGSRLLFRGYGVGRRSLSLAAGLAACDTTICLDEAHLAEPFRQTAERVVALQGEEASSFGLPSLRLIELTATPRVAEAEAIEMSESDKRQLGPRWSGRKSASLATPAGDNERDRVAALVDHCRDLLADGMGTVACVANTVGRARRVWSALGAKLGEEVDVGLLIGPQRQADRDRFLDSAKREVLFGGQEPGKPIVVVATQTFEVGLDVDVEALVTESASSSALVQRLGRLNRRGGSNGKAVIVRDAGSWLYREDEEAAWRWLESLRDAEGMIDVSVEALHEDASRPVPAPGPSAPLLTDDVVSCLVQTAPMPHLWGDPDVESFIKGADSDPTADVEICWRADLRLAPGSEDVEYSKMLLELVPPSRRELLRLNVLNAKALVAALLDHSNTGAARAALSDADIEGEAAVKAAREPTIASDAAARFLVVRHGKVHAGAVRADDEDTILLSAVAPGDTLILPVELGGCDEFGLNPQETKATDVASDVDPDPDEPASAIRLTAGALEEAVRFPPRRKISRHCRMASLALAETTSRSRHQEILGDLVRHLARLMPTHRGLVMLGERLEKEELVLSLRLIEGLAPDGTPLPESFEEEPPIDAGDQIDDEPESDEGVAQLEHACVLLVDPAGVADLAESPGEPEHPPPMLTEHGEAVRKQLQNYTERLDLAPEVGSSMLLAAACHDLGKADPRFQDFLHGGRAPLGALPIAKSVFGTRDPRLSRIAAAVSGLPRGFRHEVESVAIVADAAYRDSTAMRDVDLDLVLACIGGHHGLGLPVPNATRAGGRAARSFGADVEGVHGVASGNGDDGWKRGEWLERFWRAVDRFGPWGFSYLLGLLILADRTVSARGE